MLTSKIWLWKETVLSQTLKHLWVCCALPCDCCHKIFFFRCNNIWSKHMSEDQPSELLKFISAGGLLSCHKALLKKPPSVHSQACQTRTPLKKWQRTPKWQLRICRHALSPIPELLFFLSSESWISGLQQVSTLFVLTLGTCLFLQWYLMIQLQNLVF